MDTTSENWLKFFAGWPTELPRRGLVVSSYQEQIPFENFLIRDEIILLERRAPDALGARKVMLQLSQILAVKIVDPVNLSLFEAAGFSELRSGLASAIAN